MGSYINPPDQSKEDWLADNGREIPAPNPTNGLADLIGDADDLPVCLVDNGRFTSAAIVFNDKELFEFTNTPDSRPKMWYMVPVEKLLEVSNLEHYLK
jgi:hypothetical protein